LRPLGSAHFTGVSEQVGNLPRRSGAGSGLGPGRAARGVTRIGARVSPTRTGTVATPSLPARADEVIDRVLEVALDRALEVALLGGAAAVWRLTARAQRMGRPGSLAGVTAGSSNSCVDSASGRMVVAHAIASRIDAASIPRRAHYPALGRCRL